MVEYFEEQLQEIDRRIIIMLDSLDQLTPEDGALAMKWLPKNISSNVSFILSTLPGKEYMVLPALEVYLICFYIDDVVTFHFYLILFSKP